MSDPKILIKFESGVALALAPSTEPPTQLTPEDGRFYRKALERAYPNVYICCSKLRKVGMQPVTLLRIGSKSFEGQLDGPTKPVVLLSQADVVELANVGR